MNRPLPVTLVRGLAAGARLSCGLVVSAVVTYLVLLVWEEFPLLLGEDAFVWSVEHIPWVVGLCVLPGLAIAVGVDRCFLRHRLVVHPR